MTGAHLVSGIGVESNRTAVSIRTKLGLSFLVTVFALTAILTTVYISKTLANSTEEFAFHAQQKMRLVDGTYQTFLENVRSDVDYLAMNNLYGQSDSTLTNYTGDFPVPADSSPVNRFEAEIEQFYANYAAHRPYLRAVYLGASDGGFVGWAHGVTGNYDPRVRPWYTAALDKPGETTVTAPYVAPTGETMISVAKPVFRADGNLLGVQSVDVTLRQLTELVRSVRLGETGYMMLIDEDGTILCDPSNDDNLFRNVADIQDPLYQSLASGPSMSFEIESFGRGDLDVRSIDLPRWLLFAPLACGFALLAVEFLRLLLLGEPASERPGEGF